VVLLGWFALVYRPASSRLTEVKGQVAAMQAEVAALEARLARLQELKRNEEELRAQAVRFDKALPADPAVSSYVRQVEGIAKEAGIDFMTIGPGLPAEPTAAAAPAAAAPAAPTPSSPAPSSPGPAATAAAPAAQAPAATALRSISVSISAAGSFFDIQEFMAKMEGLERAIRIDDFSLSGAAEEGGGSPKLSLSLKLQMFMGGPAAPAPGTTEPGADAPDAVDRFTGGATQGVE
jgi:Tfp pilus assembly protein PilO